MLKEQKETVGLAKGGWNAKSCSSQSEPQDSPPTLASMGIDRKLSARAQKIAAVPEAEFEEDLIEFGPTV